MRQIATLALAVAIVAAPAAFAASSPIVGSTGSTCCAGKSAGTASGTKCDPASCKDEKKCTPQEMAKCAAAAEKKAEAPKAPKG